MVVDKYHVAPFVSKAESSHPRHSLEISHDCVAFAIRASLLVRMGADLKRKGARKRKFGGQNSESLLDTGVKLDFEGTSANEPPKKKSKQAPLAPSSSESIFMAEKITAGKVAVVVESTDQGTEETSPTQKAQRFIVFIGPSSLFRYAWLSHLTACFSPRQYTLHCNG